MIDNAQPAKSTTTRALLFAKDTALFILMLPVIAVVIPIVAVIVPMIMGVLNLLGLVDRKPYRPTKSD